jgi:hypothetical protein
MDLSVVLWIVVPIALVHLLARTNRGLFFFQLAVDVGLLLLPGRVLLQGLHIGPGVPAALDWGGAITMSGSPEQTDLPLQFEPWWEEVRRLVGSGNPPWISDRIGAGAPLYANGQTGLPFPLHLPVWVLGPERGNDVMSFWKLEIAALGGFVLLRRLRVRPLAAAVGALPYAFGLYQLEWLVQGMAWVFALAPWSLSLLLGTLRGSRRSAAGLAAVLGILAGWSVHPETAAFLWMAVALAGAVLAWGRVHRLRRLLMPFLLAVFVAGIGAVPVIANVAGSSKLAGLRRGPIYPDTNVGVGLKARVAAMILVPWREGNPGVGTWHLPFPHAAVAIGVGAIPFVLILGARLRRRHRRAAGAFGLISAGAAALTFQVPGIGHLAARLPVIGVMTWVRCGFLIGLGVSLLGGLAFDGWLRRNERKRMVISAVVIEAVVAGLAVTGTVPPQREVVAAVCAPGILGALAATGAGPWFVPLTVGLEVGCNDWRLIAGSRAVASPPAIVTALRNRVAAEGGRVLGIGDALPPNLAARLGLSDVRSADPVRPLALTRLHHALGAVGMDLAGPVTMPWAGLAGAWGVRWLASPPVGVEGPAGAHWREVYADDFGRLYENPLALATMRLATRAVLSPGDPSTGAWEVVDFSNTAVTDALLPLGGDGVLIPIEERPWRHTARVSARGTVLAVLHVPQASGWRVFLDAREVRPVEADLGAMGVVVGDGEHEVRWEYAPPGLVAGAVLSLAGLSGCLLLSLSSVRRRR